MAISKRSIRGFLRDTAGVSGIEYALMAGIAMAVAGILVVVGLNLDNTYCQIAQAIGGTGEQCVGGVAISNQPNAFSFADSTNAALNTVVPSGTVTLSGTFSGDALTVTGANGLQYKVNGGGWVNAGVAGTVNSGDTIQLQMTSSSTEKTTETATVTVSTTSATWNLITKAVSGNLYVWGDPCDNINNQNTTWLSGGNCVAALTPTLLRMQPNWSTTITNAVAISMGGQGLYEVVRSDHTVTAFGNTGYYALGNGNSGQSSNGGYLSAVSGLTMNTVLAPNGNWGDDRGCGARSSDSKLMCWGPGNTGIYGTLNDSTWATPTPSVHPANLTVVQIVPAGPTDAGGGWWDNFAGLLTSGQIALWGYDRGNSPATEIYYPTQAAGGYSKISGLDSYDMYWNICGLRNSDGGMECGGTNTYGEWGNGNTTGDTSGIMAMGNTCCGEGRFMASMHQAFTGLTFKDLAVSNDAICGLETNGTVVCAGHGTSGQLGNGSFASSTTPVTVSGGPYTAVFGPSENGSDTFCAINASGALACWGWNGNSSGNGTGGQVGNGSNVNIATPYTIPGGHTWLSVFIGAHVVFGIASN